MTAMPPIATGDQKHKLLLQEIEDLRGRTMARMNGLMGCAQGEHVEKGKKRKRLISGADRETESISSGQELINEDELCMNGFLEHQTLGDVSEKRISGTDQESMRIERGLPRKQEPYSEDELCLDGFSPHPTRGEVSKKYKRLITGADREADPTDGGLPGSQEPYSEDELCLDGSPQPQPRGDASVDQLTPDRQPRENDSPVDLEVPDSEEEPTFDSTRVCVLAATELDNNSPGKRVDQLPQTIATMIDELHRIPTSTVPIPGHNFHNLQMAF